MGKVHTVVDRLLCSSNSGIQLIVASLRELDNEFPINHEPRMNSRNRRSQRRMRNLQGVCKRDKMSVTSKLRSRITYLIPNVNWQFLRLLLRETPGPASAKYLLNVTVTAVLLAIELWVTVILKKSTRHTIEEVESGSWWAS